MDSGSFKTDNSLEIKAESDRKFLRKFFYVGLVCIGFMLWCLYDGLVAYPRTIPPAEAYDQIRNLPAGERAEQWREMARQQGWPREAPRKTADEIRDSITMQFIMAAIAAMAGGALLFNYWRTRVSWIGATKSEVVTSWGQRFSFDQIEQIDKKKWRDKGIAKIDYRDGQRTKRFVLDDFKYKRKPTDRIMELIEQHVSPKKIVNDAPGSGSAIAKHAAQPDQDSSAAEDGSEPDPIESRHIER